MKTMKKSITNSAKQTQRVMEVGLFASRWLQAPLYLGLILAQCLYVYQFIKEVYHLLSDYKTITDNELMLGVLALIDVVMISNLLLMVIIGGWDTFVSRINLEKEEDKPTWLEHVNANVLKIKLSTAIITISAIYLLKSFVDAANISETTLMWQSIIHVVFIITALGLTVIDKMSTQSHSKHK